MARKSIKESTQLVWQSADHAIITLAAENQLIDIQSLELICPLVEILGRDKSRLLYVTGRDISWLFVGGRGVSRVRLDEVKDLVGDESARA